MSTYTEQHAELLRWHHSALMGENPPIHDGEPQVGWFKMKHRRDGAIVPVRILPDPAKTPVIELIAYVGFDVDREVDEIWLRVAASPISKAEYEYLMTERRWLRAHNPEDPRVNPKDPIDLSKATLPEFKPKGK